MRDALIIFVAIIAAIAIGGYLFMNGGDAFNAPVGPAITEGDSSFMVIGEGQDSGQVDRRTNFRIMSDEELVELWSLLYTSGGPAIPPIDFSKYEVIAVFDGSHSSGGYRVAVTDVVDADGVRTVHIRREEPGDTCVVTDAITKPFQLVRVSKTTLSLAKAEETVVTECR